MRKVKLTYKNGESNIIEINNSDYNAQIYAIRLDAELYNRDNENKLKIEDVFDTKYIQYDEETQSILNVSDIEFDGFTHSIDIADWNEVSKYPLSGLYMDNKKIAVKLSAAKSLKKAEISSLFDEVCIHGIYTSTVLGIIVDCRRTDTKNDYQNVVGLISSMNRNNIEHVGYVGVYDTVNATKDQIQQLAYEMEDRAISLYNQKWGYLEELAKAKTVKEIESIEVSFK